jgi:lipopolysaccharide assembly protein A
MLTIILFLIVGSLLAYFSQYNVTPVTVNLGFYIFSNVPLFYVITGSLISGLVLAYMFHLVHAISNLFELRDKSKEIKKNKDEVLQLTKRVHQLEIENEKLKHSAEIEPVDHHAL